MQHIEKITGMNRFKLFEQLERERVFIKMTLVGTDYERLIFIMGIRPKSRNLYFKIDYPKDFRAAVAGVDAWRIRFEYIGSDKALYKFETSGGEISKEGIWIRFPEYIERIQRRQFFRLEVPLGTRIHFIINSTEHAMVVIDVSEEGALISIGKQSQAQSILHPDEYLMDLNLVFPEGEEIKIKEALIKRAIKDPLSNRYRYSLQFTDIDKREQK
jgi:c-di-GMP-binding flagellar brake protein YcgR